MLFRSLARLQHWQNLRLTEGFAPIRAAWMERGPERGSVLTLRQGDNPVSGRYEGLAEDGGLLLATAGRLHAFHAGEVAHGTEKGEERDASRG